jgi:ABC-type dipeptide/oligopeptide/nickel transport system permease subunit
MARIVRGQVMALKNQEFIDAAIGLGLSNFRIIMRHILPNITGPINSVCHTDYSAVMLLEAF